MSGCSTLCPTSGLLLLPPDFDGDRTKPAGINPQPKLFKAFTDYIKLNKTVGVGSVGMLNKAVADKNNVGMLIAVAETIHDKKIGAIADQITERFRQEARAWCWWQDRRRRAKRPQPNACPSICLPIWCARR